MKGQLFASMAWHWIDVEPSINGTATFNPVGDDGLPLFSQIFSVQFTAELNTGNFTAVPVCALKSISQDLSTIVANVITPTILGLLGATAVAAPDGVKIHCLVMGLR
jgi:hypothetical protein